MAKVVCLLDASGARQHFDVSEIKAQKLNQWKGWTCSVGINSLHIDFDGGVWAGTCRVGGSLGNIYDGWEAPEEWQICTRVQCNCGTEIKIPKTMKGHEDILGDTTETGEIDLDTVVGVDYTRRMDLHIQWDLGRFCNYDCSYCLKGPKGVHNDTEPHKPIKALIETVNKMHMANLGERLRFCFSGGEPTLHPKFINLCEHIKSLGHGVHLTTNGSKGPAYWARLVRVIDVASISVHFEFIKEPNLLKTIQVALDYKMMVPHFGLEVKLMTKPEDWDRMETLRDELLNLSGFKQFAVLQVAPLRIMLGQHELMDYTDEQIQQFGVVE